MDNRLAMLPKRPENNRPRLCLMAVRYVEWGWQSLPFSVSAAGIWKNVNFFLNVRKCEFWFSVSRPLILSALSTIELTCIKLFAQVLCFVVLILKSILSDGFCLCIQHHNIAVLLCAVVNVAALLRAAVNGNITLSQHHDMTTSHDITLSHDITWHCLNMTSHATFRVLLPFSRPAHVRAQPCGWQSSWGSSPRLTNNNSFIVFFSSRSCCNISLKVQCLSWYQAQVALVQIPDWIKLFAQVLCFVVLILKPTLSWVLSVHPASQYRRINIAVLLRSAVNGNITAHRWSLFQL